MKLSDEKGLSRGAEPAKGDAMRRGTIVEKIVAAAFSVMHHDAVEGDPATTYERVELTKLVTALLKRRASPSKAEGEVTTGEAELVRDDAKTGELVLELEDAAADYRRARDEDGAPDQAALRDVGYTHGHLFTRCRAMIESLASDRTRIGRDYLRCDIERLDAIAANASLRADEGDRERGQKEEALRALLKVRVAMGLSIHSNDDLEVVARKLARARADALEGAAHVCDVLAAEWQPSAEAEYSRDDYCARCCAEAIRDYARQSAQPSNPET